MTRLRGVKLKKQIEFITREEFDEWTLELIKLEQSVKNMKLGIKMVLDLFTEEDYGRAIARFEKESKLLAKEGIQRDKGG